MRQIRMLCAIGAIAAAPLAVAAELSSTGEFLDGVVAIVDDGVILRSQLNEQTAVILQRAREQNLTLPPAAELREQLLERLIVTEIQLQRADRLGVQISDQMLNEAIGQIAQQQNIAFEDMPAALAADGIEYAKFRRDLREEITLDQLRRADVGRRIAVSPREIELCTADLEDNVVVNSDYNLSNITISISDSTSSAAIDAALAEANDIVARINEGTEFAALAIRYSDAQNALDGGALGWLKGEQLPTLYTDAVAGMQTGDVSQPIRTPGSFHIIKVNDMRSAVQRSEVNQVLVRHILITPNEIIDDQTAKQRLEDALARIAAGEEFGELAKLMSDDPGSANSGGEMDWSGPGTFVDEFEQVINATEIGAVSEPFQTRFGWHIVEVMDRRVYDNTEDLKESNCIIKIRNSKMEEETQLWIQRLRDEAYVHILI
ncbi:MAG: peptidylprolyl isomerase [Gammaproteobacteria bacterium]|nr:peptidylprolyl isomerase [Gammaproteobacteria bacterium]MDH5302805.1 peptidylprolyl isomerase [Gammaproteobacteria bacterium]MDH5322365.1 peptidylprolyl isomerase [Gammaproteobacteria bacterium]